MWPSDSLPSELARLRLEPEIGFMPFDVDGNRQLALLLGTPGLMAGNPFGRRKEDAMKRIAGFVVNPSLQMRREEDVLKGTVLQELWTKHQYLWVERNYSFAFERGPHWKHWLDKWTSRVCCLAPEEDESAKKALNMAYEKVRGSRVLDDDEDVTLMSNPGAVLEALVHLSTICSAIKTPPPWCWCSSQRRRRQAVPRIKCDERRERERGGQAYFYLAQCALKPPPVLFASRAAIG